MKTFEEFMAEEMGGVATTASVGNTPGAESDAGFGKKPPKAQRRKDAPGQEDNMPKKSGHK